MADDVPLFEQLNPFTWRDVTFPVTSMGLSLEQDQAQHKPYGKDGADVEGTGRAALVFTASIPFRNGVVASKTEEFGVLYPTQWKAFLAAMADKTVGYLTHPELGEIQCKPQKCETTWDGNKRDGADVQAVWVETTEYNELLSDALSYDSPITQVTLAALSLDSEIRLRPDQFPQTPTYTPDFGEFMRQLGGLGDQLSIASGRLTGQLDQLTYRVNAIKGSLERNGDPRNFTALQAISRLKENLRKVSNALGANQKTILYYRAPRDITFAGLADLIPAKLPELIRMNPRLLQRPVIPVNTAVQYLPIAA